MYAIEKMLSLKIYLRTFVRLLKFNPLGWRIDDFSAGILVVASVVHCSLGGGGDLKLLNFLIKSIVFGLNWGLLKFCRLCFAAFLLAK